METKNTSRLNLSIFFKKHLANPPILAHNLPVNHFATMQLDKPIIIQFTAETPIGTNTNFGRFEGFNSIGFAMFTKDGRKGVVGSKSLNIVQVIP